MKRRSVGVARLAVAGRGEAGNSGNPSLKRVTVAGSTILSFGERESRMGGDPTGGMTTQIGIEDTPPV